MPDLKPCPFCGNHVQFVWDYHHEISGIYCSKCQMKTVFVLRFKKTDTYGTKMEAWAEKWDRRDESAGS